MLCKSTAFIVLLSLLSVMTPGLLCGQESTQSVEPTEANFAVWKSHILPEQEDLVWRNVAWKTTFGDGVIAANKADKPLLLWVMNGHPFGCT